MSALWKRDVLFIERDGTITEKRAKYYDCYAGLTNGGWKIFDLRVGRADIPKNYYMVYNR